MSNQNLATEIASTFPIVTFRKEDARRCRSVSTVQIARLEWRTLMFSRSRRKSAGLHDNLKPPKPTAATVQWDSPTGASRKTESSPAAGAFLRTRKTDLSNEPENRGDTLSQWNRGRMAKLADAQDLKS